MTYLTAAAIQMRSSDDPEENARTAAELVREAAAAGARYVQTPEVTNLVQRDKARAADVIRGESDDVTLRTLRGVAAECGITLHIGSLALAEDGNRWVNRAFLIGPDGTIRARYDKIHLFDVALSKGETIRESDNYQGGDCAVLAPVGPFTLGISICFDLRFAALYSQLADRGVDILTAPSAFTVRTGEAHWHTLTRARAIENGAYLVAATQEGKHADGRTTYGHSIIIDPWGDVLAEASETPAVITAQLSPERVHSVRRQIPSLAARKPFRIINAGHCANEAAE